jgi:hypothetical protein
VTGQPRARFRPRGEAHLQVYRDDERLELSLDDEAVDLPPQWDPRLSKPPVRARVERVAGGHRLVSLPGFQARVNNRAVEKSQMLQGGDEIELERFVAVYTTAREELSWPMTLVVWPPEGPPIEIRTHRSRIDIGQSSGDVLVDDPTLDALHCVVKRYRNGIMQIEDQGSYNGVYVDGKKVQDGMKIRDGAEIRIGNTRVKAWAEAPEAPDLREMPVQDQYDGLPSDGIDPHAEGPLKPYALELGPDYVQSRRRTFDDDVPTRVEARGEQTDVRPRRRPATVEDYGDYEGDPGGSGSVPDWAPLDANAPQRQPSGQKRSRFQESETGQHWEDRDKGGLTLVHKKDRAIKPREGK